MVVRTSRTKNKRRKPAAKQNSAISYVVLGGILLLGAAGWYHNTFEKNVPESKTVAVVKPVATPVKKPYIPVTNPTVDVNIPRPKAPIRQRSANDDPIVALLNLQKTTNVPYKPDTQLPPKAVFGVNNAANVIFSKRDIIIYAKADSNSKTVAIVKAGQEMRSYEHVGNWHRVVVPSTDIIGWAKADDITHKTSTSNAIIDRNLTSSIKH